MSRFDDIGLDLENPVFLSGFVRFFPGCVKNQLLDLDRPHQTSPTVSLSSDLNVPA